MPRFRIGTDDFKKLIDEGGYFVDKSMLIRNTIDGSDVTLLPRPRRFGKTLNMTMLRYFFEKTDVDRSSLFTGLAIAADDDAMAHQGRYPVIYLSLKDIRGRDWDVARAKLSTKLAALYGQHAEALEGLTVAEDATATRLRNQTASTAEEQESLKHLVSHLHAHHGQPVVLLIDEYDTPLIEAWQHGYYDEMVDFMRSWLGGGLKHEYAPALYRAVLTGILRVAKESIFSGLNNLDVPSILEPGPFADAFGFTQPELDAILRDFSLSELSPEIQEWYNGYLFGGKVIYNPWSVISCVSKHPLPIGPQWLNTASNELIHAEMEAGGLELKRDLEKLLAGEPLRHPITDNTVFDDIGRSNQTIWSFLFFSGYLKASDPQRSPIDATSLTWRLEIPNLEISIAFKQFVNRMLQPVRGGIDSFLDCFLDPQRHLPELEPVLLDLVLHLVSHHDPARYPEAFYHALFLGLLANLRSIYEIRSNTETGYGRADITLRPKTTDYPTAFVIEFKSIPSGADLDAAAAEALDQIERKAYAAQLQESGVDEANIRRLAIVIAGKRLAVRTIN